MVTKDELKILIKKHFEHIKKNNLINIDTENETKLVEYFSNLIYLLQFYDNVDMSIRDNKFVSDGSDWTTILCACNNAGAAT